MNSKNRVIAQIGNKQKLFEDRETYPSESCDFIENIIMCNLSEISKDGIDGRIRFTGKDGKMFIQMSIIEGNCYLSDESSGVVLVRLKGDKIKSVGYYGIDADFNFVADRRTYSMDSVSSIVDSIKSFCISWKVGKGSIGAKVFIIDNYEVFENMLKDSFFNDSYILGSY